jgi:carboxyl-terminal processing protease
VRIDDWPTLTPSGSKPTDDIIKRLKGKPGTKVKLYVWRHGMDPALIDRPTEEMAIEIEREEIVIPPVKAQMLPGNVGLVQLTTFSRVASEELRAKITDMLKHGAQAIVLDLRNNSGGLLTEARDVSNLFLPKAKLVVSTESRSQDVERLYTKAESLVPADMPVAVLINGFSLPRRRSSPAPSRTTSARSSSGSAASGRARCSSSCRSRARRTTSTPTRTTTAATTRGRS